MKLYRLQLLPRVCVTLFLASLTISALVDFLSRQNGFLQAAILLIGPLAIWFFNAKGIAIDVETVEVLPSIRHRQSLYWGEIETVAAGWAGEMGSIQLLPKPGSGKKPLCISLFGMSLELVRDIIRHVPPTTRIVVDERFHRKLVGRHVIVYRGERLYETTAADWTEFWAGRKAVPSGRRQ